jgi:hypothetical protein
MQSCILSKYRRQLGDAILHLLAGAPISENFASRCTKVARTEKMPSVRSADSGLVFWDYNYSVLLRRQEYTKSGQKQ